jgi:3-oxoacyl-[acyl-carrier protein] reductase
MNLGLKDKTVLITGASKNIGKSIAIAMAKEETNVIICARNKLELNEVLSLMNNYSGQHYMFCVDLENKKGPSKLLNFLKINNIVPDVIVHNLGGSLQITNQKFSRKDLENVWQFNLGIAHEINDQLIPSMIKKEWGRIIHVSSLAAKTAKGYIPYVSAKCALEGYVKAMSRYLSNRKVIMSAIAPGLVELPDRYFTKMKKENPEKLSSYYDEHLPIREMAQPDEIAEVVCFLCSIKNNYMPGAVIPFDGGGS